MKNKKCPERKICASYMGNACEGCGVGDEILKLHKRIDRLKKQNETLTIQRNAWALAAKAVKKDTVRKMQERLNNECLMDRGYEVFLEGTIDQIAKEMLEGEKQ